MGRQSCCKERVLSCYAFVIDLGCPSLSVVLVVCAGVGTGARVLTYALNTPCGLRGVVNRTEGLLERCQMSRSIQNCFLLADSDTFRGLPRATNSIVKKLRYFT